jgi:hypothetical protein
LASRQVGRLINLGYTCRDCKNDLQSKAAPRDDEASGVAFRLCLTQMDLWKSSPDVLPRLGGGSLLFVGVSGRWFE